MTAATRPGVEDLIGLIYDCAIAPSRTPMLLCGLAEHFAATFADSFSREHDGSHATGSVHGLDRDDYEKGMLGTWSSRNPWGKKAPVMSAGDVRATWEFLSREELLRSEMYGGYLRERGLHEGLRFEIWSDQAGIEDISLLRPFSAGAFSTGEIALGRALMPHLQRAAGLRRRLQRAELIAEAGMSALEALDHGVVLVDRSARAVYVNPAAAALFAQRDAVAYENHRLTGLSASASRALSTLLDRATLPAGRARAGAALLPSRGVAGNLDRPLAVLSMPLRADDGDALPGHPAAILCFSRARSAVTEHSLRPVSALFGLTSAETRLAALLLSGASLAEIAAAQGRSLATVRSHLARLMAKTETARQGELVIRLNDIPRLPAGQSFALPARDAR